MSWPLCLGSQQNLGRIRREGRSCLIRASSWPHHPNIQGRKCEAVGGVPFESTLLLYDLHFLSLRVTAVGLRIAPIKNLLLFTEIRLGMELWLSFFYKISTGFARVPGPRALPCRVQCKLIPAGPRCHTFRPSELFIVLLLQIPSPFAPLC